MAFDYSWIYIIIFLAIPLARIIPRILNKRKNHNQYDEPRQVLHKYSTYETSSQKEIARDKIDTRLVLAELNKGSKTFGMIQKNTRIKTEELDKILEELETKGLLRVQEQQGFFGQKILLFPTEKGIKEYYS